MEWVILVITKHLVMEWVTNDHKKPDVELFYTKDYRSKARGVAKVNSKSPVHYWIRTLSTVSNIPEPRDLPDH
jgi:hypothetical protein